ncbi:MAG: hypothetical protein LBJ44_06735 [Propionibacteriaceae bacterium]|jgi:hypothetical protein|nr:hypothetical protein [Propionibacteriaceae bacterium]
MRPTDLYSRRWASQPARTQTATAGAAGFDAVVGAGLLATGLCAGTAWYAADAAYYLALALIRAYLLRRLLASAGSGEADEGTAFRRAGYGLAATGVAYFTVAAAMFFAGHAPHHTGLAPYGVAVMAFAKAGLAITGTLSARGAGSPVRLALRIVALCDALVSMSLTQYALMSLVADPDAASTSASVGMGFAALIATCGLVMALREPAQRPAADRLEKEETTQ